MVTRTNIAADNIPVHGQPFPTAVRVGNMLFSSAVGGENPETGAMPVDIETQVANCFQTIRNIMAAAGGSPDTIGKATVFLRDRDDRAHVNPEWERMFPDENSRPVRHTVVLDLPPGRLVQIEFIAVL